MIIGHCLGPGPSGSNSMLSFVTLWYNVWWGCRVGIITFSCIYIHGTPGILMADYLVESTWQLAACDLRPQHSHLSHPEVSTKQTPPIFPLRKLKVWPFKHREFSPSFTSSSKAHYARSQFVAPVTDSPCNPLCKNQALGCGHLCHACNSWQGHTILLVYNNSSWDVYKLIQYFLIYHYWL